MEKRNELQKTLSAKAVWALALGSIIGWGCFVLPGDLLQKSGPLGASLGFMIGAFFMIVIAISYGYMVKAVPVAGGEFAYAYNSYGRNHAYICGWFLTLGYLSIVALNGTALALLGKFVLPGVFAKGYLYSVAGWDVYLGEVLLASIAIILFGVFNYRGVKLMGSLQLIIVALLCGSVALITAGTLLNPDASFSFLNPMFSPGKTSWASIAAVLAIAPFLYVGFDTIPQSAEEFNFSHDKSFSLMFWAIFIGAGMYAVVTLATGMAQPWQDLIAGKPMWATGEALHQTLGNIGVLFLVVALLMAIFSGINGFYMATSRLLFSMGRAKVLPAWFSDVHPKHQTPHKAVIFVMLISLIAPWFGRQVVVWIVDMAAVGTAIGYLYTCLSAYLVLKAQSESKGTLIAVIGSIFSLIILALLIVPGSPAFLSVPSWVAMVVWVGMGAIFYMTQAKNYLQIPKDKLDYLILGNLADNVVKESK